MQETDDGQIVLAPTEKLTDWEKEPSLQTLKGDLEAALPHHNSLMTKINHWNDLMAVRGKARPKKVQGRSSVQPKLIRRQAEWRYSALTEPFNSGQDLFQVKPRTFEDTEAARQNALLLNWQFSTKINRVKFIDDYVRSTVDEGTCIVRTGWKRVTRMARETVPVFGFYEPESQEQLDMLQQAIELKATNPRGFEEEAPEELKAAVEHYEETGEPSYAIIEGEREVEVEQVLENRPELTVFNPNNVVIDPSCEGDIDKAMFAIFMIETNQSELRKEGRYKNLDKINWTDAAPVNDPNRESQTPGDFQFKDALRKRVIAYEYWGYFDIEGNGELTPFVCTWVGNTIIRMELNPFADQKLPLVVVPYMPLKRELYGETDAELLEDNQNILGAVSRGMIDLLGRSANSQQGFAKGMLDPLNKRRFEEGRDYEFNPNMPPMNGHIQHKFPELPQSALIMLNLQNQEAEALTGVKSFGGGLSGEAYGDVAAGVRGMLDAASKREMAILRRLAEGMKQIARKILAMNQEFLSEEEVVRVTNEQNITVRREDIQGEYDLNVDISTAEVENAQVQDLAFMLQTMGPNLPFDLTKIILTKIAKLKRMPDLAEMLEQFTPEPDPHQQAIQQLELQKLQEEINAIRAKSQLDLAKARREMAGASQAELDAIEQETGTKHLRDLDKQQAQARGNMDLTITKELAAKRKEGERPGNIEAAVGYNNLTEMRDQAGTL